MVRDLGKQVKELSMKTSEHHNEFKVENEKHYTYERDLQTHIESVKLQNNVIDRKIEGVKETFDQLETKVE